MTILSFRSWRNRPLSYGAVENSIARLNFTVRHGPKFRKTTAKNCRYLTGKMRIFFAQSLRNRLPGYGEAMSSMESLIFTKWCTFSMFAKSFEKSPKKRPNLREMMMMLLLESLGNQPASYGAADSCTERLILRKRAHFCLSAIAKSLQRLMQKKKNRILNGGDDDDFVVFLKLEESPTKRRCRIGKASFQRRCTVLLFALCVMSWVAIAKALKKGS